MQEIWSEIVCIQRNGTETLMSFSGKIYKNDFEVIPKFFVNIVHGRNCKQGGVQHEKIKIHNSKTNIKQALHHIQRVSETHRNTTMKVD